MTEGTPKSTEEGWLGYLLAGVVILLVCGIIVGSFFFTAGAFYGFALILSSWGANTPYFLMALAVIGVALCIPVLLATGAFTIGAPIILLLQKVGVIKTEPTTPGRIADLIEEFLQTRRDYREVMDELSYVEPTDPVATAGFQEFCEILSSMEYTEGKLSTDGESRLRLLMERLRSAQDSAE